ncbi:MAG: 2-oxo acid dehydrogenase subunit E2 [Gammaproteobacteria bacterium]|nr:2-oxo acid dehydrogenase subunit E2 [Gammaproteobacteria bacterium]
MPSEVYLVKVGMTMTEGVVEEWYIADGATVEQGAPVYRLETEKVNMDVEADVAGIVKHIVEAGTTLEPGEVVGWIFAADEPIPDVLPTPTANPNIAAVDSASDSKSTEATNVADKETTGSSQPVRASPAAKRLARERNVSLQGVVGSGPGGRITEKDVPTAAKADEAKPARVLASPAARRLATELNVPIDLLTGTGPRGRITKDDVEQAAAKQSLTSASEGMNATPLQGKRKVIAERMFDSLRSTAQLTMDMEVVMDDAIKMRNALIEEWKTEAVRVTYTDLVVAAALKALQKHKAMNSTFEESELRMHGAIHIGIAVALDDGLIVPVIHDAQSKSLRALAQEAADLATRARTGRLNLDEVSGGTFTVTSLGMYGVDSFTPILNAPQTGILGVGRIYDSVRWEEERPIRTQCMRLSLTWDHRIVDGAPAAAFLREVKLYLEAPYRLVV